MHVDSGLDLELPEHLVALNDRSLTDRKAHDEAAPLVLQNITQKPHLTVL